MRYALVSCIAAMMRAKQWSPQMKAIILTVLAVVAFNASALKIDNGDNKNVYFSEDGKRLDPLEAYKEAMQDRKVLQCSYVEAVGNQKTGKVALKKKQ